jgi:hypothetical protein
MLNLISVMEVNGILSNINNLRNNQFRCATNRKVMGSIPY